MKPFVNLILGYSPFPSTSVPQCLHHRAVSPSTPLPDIEPWLKALLEPPRAISATCKAPLEEMKKLFPLKEVEKKKQLKTSAQIFGEGYVWPKAKQEVGGRPSPGHVRNMCTL